MSSRPDQRVAFVGEGWDMHRELLSARFSARWEERGGDGTGQGPSDVPLDDALTWAREHATVVYVQLDGVSYSAGSEQRGGEGEVLPWPPEGLGVRPRPPGTPFDGSVQSRPWRVRGCVSVDGRDVTEATTAAVREALRGEERLSAVEVSRLEDDGMLVDVAFEGRSAGLAIRTIETLLEELLDRLGIGGTVTRVEYSTHPRD